ncbi:MAG TPA: glycerol-3-phosphate 1-O-acyltransferase PlsY [Candidatus Aminicenantes bacterium]|nr:glycerol-3-phosphate 1-O-acyltransferase PlsY [Candidatus Aminicenantes bacterium]HRY65212.1 glycerol-3-phosphate 1-O-acyltransferase PlsY [Candidatus Aminicenantes bacterium]HRZ72320.1 glycerol-3-phosphate 1-O-acyltransferase PlsY [Candidatus Aminicenantes bacterium]
MKILVALASYLLGSIPTGYLVVRLIGRRDVREFGSGNTGATNVMRLKGWTAALPVALVDVAKGFLPVALAGTWFADPVFSAACGFLAVVGHCFPFSIGFRGGKGVATSLGAFAAIAWGPCLGSLGLFLLIVGLTRYVSLGSIAASLAFPVIIFASGGSRPVAAVALAIALLVVARHRGNIRRVIAGTERKLGEKEK